MGWLIRLGTLLKLKRARWNHEFIVSDLTDVDGAPLIIQATMRGVTEDCRLDQVAPGGSYVTMPPPPECDRAKLLEFAKKQVGTEYGFLTDLAMAIDIVSWDWVPSFRGARKPSWQCAALTNESMRFAGWLHEWLDVYDILPDEGYEALVG